MVGLSTEPSTKLLSALTAYLTVLHEIVASLRVTRSGSAARATVTKNAATARPTQIRKRTRTAIYDAFERAAARRMGGAKRYPSITEKKDDGYRFAPPILHSALPPPASRPASL